MSRLKFESGNKLPLLLEIRGASYTDRALYRAALVLNNETIMPTAINVEPNALG